MTEIIPQDMRNIVNFVEEHYLVHGEIPGVTAISRATAIKEVDVADWLTEPLLIKMLERRGITFGSNGLTPEMLACANVLLDFSDRRSKKEKLEALGLTTQQYRAFTRNPKFNEYVTRLSEQMLPDSMHEAHVALLKNVERGDTNSLKLFYEITGRHNPAAQGQVNVEAILTRIFEIITVHVKDPRALEAIASDLGNLAASNRAPVAGELVSGL